jgi:hypothetical protein
VRIPNGAGNDGCHGLALKENLIDRQAANVGSIATGFPWVRPVRDRIG